MAKLNTSIEQPLLRRRIDNATGNNAKTSERRPLQDFLCWNEPIRRRHSIKENLRVHPHEPETRSLQRGEVGAGYAGHGLKLDLSIGQAQSEPGVARSRGAPLPRVLPAEGGVDVAAPLWFRNSTATSVNARGQVSLAPDTSLDLGASVGHVKFLPGSGLAADDALDQTTLSLGIQHGAVRGAIVGHMLEPDVPGTALGPNQRWSGVDLGISVRLPWRGELNFGAQNVWSSGRAPLLFGPGGAAPDQGRVPYVQYHQTL